MVTEARTVEGDLFDTGSLGFLGHALAYQTSGGNVGAVSVLAREFFANLGLKRGSADEHTIAFRRDDVRVNVLIRAEYRQAMYAQFGDFPTGRYRTTQTGDFLVHDSSLPARLFLLGFFHDDTLVGITHALALIRLGTAIGADFSRDLTNYLLVGALDHDFGGSGALDFDAFRHFVQDVMRETKLQFQRVALYLGAEAHTNEVQFTLKALADAGNHIVDQGAQRTRHGMCMAGIVCYGKRQLVVLELDVDVAGERLCQCAQRTLDDDLVGFDLGFHPFGQFDRVFCYT